MNDNKYLQLAIDYSKKSYKAGAFPAGSVLVNNGKVITKTTSAKYPKINFHAESKAIDKAINSLNKQLLSCTLYCSMEPCLMCLSRAYWAGIRRIVFAVKKETVPHEICYESSHNHLELLEKFNEKIKMIHIEELQNKALKIVKKWLKENT